MKLLDPYEAACKVRRRAARTLPTYRRWVEEFLRFPQDRNGRWMYLQKMGEPEGEAFLPHLADNRRVAASTLNQALNAILFLSRSVVTKDWVLWMPCGPTSRSVCRLSFLQTVSSPQ
jgi:hypothetical protein